ncbi:hypothetical protein [Cohnella yongneupensis]|uniref:UvrA DNA-binding domain-containing protein n=1 Tax=Cohnella yongneupensis TaxID=425006 RepID=A0ABW0QWV8_9BACL
MKRIVFPYKPFNAKRTGALIGVITVVLETVRLLYATIAAYRGHRPFEACPACGDKEVATDIDPKRMIAPELSLKDGAVLLWAGSKCGPVEMIKQLANTIGINTARPLAEQDARFIDILLYGYDKEPITYAHKNKQSTGYYRGCVNDLRFMRDAGTTSKGNLRAIAYFSERIECPICGGTKLNPENAAVTIDGRNFAEASRLPVPELLRFVQRLPAALDEREFETSREAIEELEARLIYLQRIGLLALSPSGA